MITKQQFIDKLAASADPFTTFIEMFATGKYDGCAKDFKDVIDAGYFKRKFCIDGGYPHPRDAVLAFINSHLGARFKYPDINQGPGVANVSRFAMREWSKYGHPVYFIGAELERALNRTNLPKDMMVGDLMLPFPVLQVCYKSGQSATIVNYEDVGKTFYLRSNKIEGTAVCYVGRELPLLEFENVSSDVPADVNAESVSIAHLAIATILFLNSRPDYHTARQHDTVRKASRDKIEMVKPRIIGANYKVRCVSDHASGDGTGRKLPHHWRCGHFKTVRYGKGLALSRVGQWIEPYEVNKP
jgi:hypothetical protein